MTTHTAQHSETRAAAPAPAPIPMPLARLRAFFVRVIDDARLSRRPSDAVSPVPHGITVGDARMLLHELDDEVKRLRGALFTLSTHDFTGQAGCRLGQTIAAKALRGEPLDADTEATS